jgi:hypothetical protein
MTSGTYTVSDIYCLGCGKDVSIGWTYVSIFPLSSKPKKMIRNTKKGSSS